MAIVLFNGDLLEVKLYAYDQGQYSINTLHYAVSATAGDSDTDASAAVALDTIFAPLMKAVMGGDCSYEGLSAQIIKPTRRPKIVTVVSRGVGSTEGDQLPRHVAGLVKKLTTVASKHGRGRLYVPFPTEAENSGAGFPVADYITRLQAIGDAIATQRVVGAGGDTATLTPVVYDRTNNTGLEITSCAASGLWASCRRRQDSRGTDRPPF